MAGRTSLIQFFTIAFFVVLLVPAAFADTSGTFTVVKGDVQITSKSGLTEKAKIGKKVVPSDTIVAGKDARAKIVMADKNIINISPDTKLILEKYIYDPAKGDKQVTLDIAYGKVRATVEQKYDGEKNKFNIKTPTAVAGVRGTDFLTGYTPGKKETKIITFEGQVAVGTPGPQGQIMNPVFVNPGQMTTAVQGAPPSVPAAVPKDEMKQLNNETKAETATDTSASNSTGQAQEEKKEDKKEDKKEEKKDEAKADDQKKDESKSEDKKDERKEDKKDEKKSDDKKEDKKAERSEVEDKKEAKKESDPKKDDAKNTEQAKSEESSKKEEPVKKEETAKKDEPAKKDEVAKREEPAKKEDVAKREEAKKPEAPEKKDAPRREPDKAVAAKEPPSNVKTETPSEAGKNTANAPAPSNDSKSSNNNNQRTPASTTAGAATASAPSAPPPVAPTAPTLMLDRTDLAPSVSQGVVNPTSQPVIVVPPTVVVAPPATQATQQVINQVNQIIRNNNTNTKLNIFLKRAQ
ncbi:MAG: hypothetical protein RJB66_2049 [Pseudomonadota bacterium]|jgi:hypothetical protein